MTEESASIGSGHAARRGGSGLRRRPDHGSMIVLNDVEWAPIESTPLSVAVLRGDPSTGAHVCLIKLPAGFVAPNHAHTGDYHGVNLTETWKHMFIETDETRELPPES